MLGLIIGLFTSEHVEHVALTRMTDVIYKHSCVDELRKLLPSPSWTVVFRVLDELVGHQIELAVDLVGEKEKVAQRIAALDVKAEEVDETMGAKISSAASSSSGTSAEFCKCEVKEASEVKRARRGGEDVPSV